MKYVFVVLLFFLAQKTPAQVTAFDQYPNYSGSDLGLTYSPAKSFFRIWAPTAEKAELLLYQEGLGGEPISRINLDKAEQGTWKALLPGDQGGKYYAFRVLINGNWSREVPDPYARVVGVNGRRGQIADPSQSSPAGWSKDKSPAFTHKTDAILYELHVRDASIHANSGIRQKGTFLGLAEKGTRNAAGMATGIDHLKEMGVTHIHLLPSYDYTTVDETKLDSPQYNWGYDPLNYNTPEGSYSTNPYDGRVRIREFKTLIQSLHQAGMRVVMDVVYNHTMFTEHSWFNELVPGYYYRQNADGSFSNATACGNETASERTMMRKFMLESVLYWVKEYHIDGFRFDLMGVHDIETMNLLSSALHQVKPDILLYGEGWTAGSSPLPDSSRALKKNAYRLDRIAVFSDDLRDGIKGSVFDVKDKGFASGKPDMEESIKFGVVAAVAHPQVDYSKVNYSRAPYSAEPYQTISYCECHDNHVLWDKLALSVPELSAAERREMHKLSLAIVLSAQGIPFLHAGTEFLRTKKGNENSFDAGDAVNAIDWDLKTFNKDVVDFVKRLIRMRKAHPAFHLETAEQIRQQLRFMEGLPANMVAYTLNGKASGDKWQQILVVYNGSSSQQQLALPGGSWKPYIVNNRPAPSGGNLDGKLVLTPYSATIVYQD